MAGTVNNTLAVRFTAVANGVVPTSFTISRSAAVTDFVAIATDGGASTVLLSSTGGAISAALSLAGGDTAVVRPAKAGTWNDAATKLVAGNLLTVTPGGAQAYEAYAYLYPTPAVIVL